jgi:hypothetical protein
VVINWKIFFFIPVFIYSQFALFPPDYYLAFPTWKKVFSPSDTLHPTLLPYNELSAKTYSYQTDTTRVFRYIKWDQGIDLVFYNPLFRASVPSESVEVLINPVLEIQGGFDNIDTSRIVYSTNSRGISGTIRIGAHVLIETMFVENQSFFPKYLSDYANGFGVIPGQGRYKLFKKNGYDYAWSAGFISWQPLKNLNIQAGHFKNKTGSGVRSILLSDESFLYPQIKITAEFFRKRCQYTVWAASLMDLDSAYEKPIPGLERLFRKKPLSMQYLHINLHKFLRLGFFQSITGQTNDGKNQFQETPDIFLPVIFLWPLYKNFPAASHILWGSDLLLTPSSFLHIYGQFALRNDSLHRIDIGKPAWQAGIRYFFPEKLSFQGMMVAEINMLPDRFYHPAQAKKYYSSYTNYRESMGLPFFLQREIRIGCVLIKNRTGFQATYLHQTLQDNVSSAVQSFKGEVFYLLNRSYLLTVFARYHYRFHDFPTFTLRQNSMQFWSWGIRTRLYRINDEF